MVILVRADLQLLDAAIAGDDELASAAPEHLGADRVTGVSGARNFQLSRTTAPRSGVATPLGFSVVVAQGGLGPMRRDRLR